MGSDDGVKVLLYPLILSLRKSISLRMKCCGEVLFYSELPCDGFPEVGSEAWISIANNLHWEAKPSVYMIEVQLGNSWS